MWGESIGTGSGVRFTVWKRGRAALANAPPNRTIFIEKLTEVRRTIEQLLTQLQASEHDKFVAHLYQARKQYRLVCERPNKSNKAIERTVLSSYQIAQSLGLNGDFRGWEHLLRIRGGSTAWSPPPRLAQSGWSVILLERHGRNRRVHCHRGARCQATCMTRFPRGTRCSSRSCLPAIGKLLHPHGLEIAEHPDGRVTASVAEPVCWHTTKRC